MDEYNKKEKERLDEEKDKEEKKAKRQAKIDSDYQHMLQGR